ncbi:MAG: amino acid permease, partial [Candidatus Aminicenantes bacterium]|nr:amino acid permease [Candidatus Aminicenantes bacterium]
MNSKNGGLERRLGLFPLTNIVIANMIGAGIFTTSGLLMEQLRHPLLLLGLWAVGGLVALAGAFAYSELGAAYPHAGGEYLFLSRLYHPLLGFLSGWVSFFVGFSAPIAASAIGVTEYLARAFPEVLSVPGIPGGLMMKLYALAAILIFTLLHLQGLRWGARVQNVLTALKVGLIAALVVVGLTRSGGDWAHFAAVEPYRFDLGGWKVIGLSLMWIMFSYSGWNAAAYIGSEVRDPRRNIPRSLLLGTGAVILLYAGLNVFYVYALPTADMSGVIPVGGLAASRLFGASATKLITLLIAFAQFSSLSAFIILGPRVYYSMARDGLFFKRVAAVHPRRRVPSASILLQAAIAGVIVLSGSLDEILTYMGFSLGIFPLLAVFGVFLLRRGKELPYRMPGFPVFPLIYLLAGAAILVLGFMERPGPSSIAL